MKLARLLGAFWAVLLAATPVRATEQASYVTPVTGPMNMATFAAGLNSGLRAIASCSWGSSAPVNGPGAAALPYQCWADTTSNPVLFKRWDGASWVIAGALNTSTHVWTSYSGGGALGTAALQNIGTSGANVPLLNGSNTWAALQTIGQITFGTLASQDALTIHGQQQLYFPANADDPSCFCNTFLGNGGANLTHSIVNTTAPGVSRVLGTVTITTASPGVVTATAHGVAADAPVAFTSTGTLATPIVSRTTYYVARSPAPTTNTFSVAATVGGAAINTSGSPTGTITGYTTSLEGRYNNFNGQQSGLFATNAAYDVAHGFESMYNCVSCSWMTAYGEGTFFSNVNGNAGAALGWKACLSTIDSNETCIGYGAMLNYVGTAGGTGNNVGVGYAALNGASGATFFSVTGIGMGVGGVLSSGHDLLLGGTSTASSATTLSNSVVLGSTSGPNLTTATGQTIVGDHTGGGLSTEPNDTIIGANQNGLAGISNEIRLSDGAGLLGFRRDSAFNVYLGDSATGRKVYNYFASGSNNAGTTADASGNWAVFTGTSGTASRVFVYPDGGVSIGTPTGLSKGNTTLNMQGAVYDNGTAPTGTAGSGYARATSPTLTTPNIVGTSTNDNAAGGSVGELVSSSVLAGSAVALTSNVGANVTSISLTAGDWDVSGMIAMNPAGTTTQSFIGGSITTTSGLFVATRAGAGTGDIRADSFQSSVSTSAGLAGQDVVFPPTRYSFASTTTVYLVALSTFAVSTNAAYGYIRARRIR